MASFTAAANDPAPCCANDNEPIAAFLLDVRGRAAALTGCGLAANPYSASSFEAACWVAGWMAGCRDIGALAATQPSRVRLHAVAAERKGQ